MNLIFRVESHSGGTSEIRTANAGMNGRTLLESGGAFSKHFPHGTKTGAHFFGAKIARSSRGVKRGQGTGNPDVSGLRRSASAATRAGRLGVSLGVLFRFLNRMRFLRGDF